MMNADPRPFCRDCFSFQRSAENRCGHCGSPRLLRHNERDSLALAHIDCDAFYAAVEKRQNPALRDQPVIVGGGRRGVVSTACYIARSYGVRSAMPMFKARALCPDAVVIPPNMTLYAAVAREIRERMQSLTPLVEPLSIDEAFLDLSGAENLHGAAPALTLARWASEVEAAIGITVSIGLSYCKFLAKLASGLDKPRGFSIIGRREAQTRLAVMDIGAIWGVGAAARAKFSKAGFSLIGDVQARSETDMMRLFGSEGQRLWRLAQGDDPRKVSPERTPKSISAEITLESDIEALDEMQPLLFKLCEKVSRRLKEANFSARNITLKLKTSDFQNFTRASSGFAATQLAARLYPLALALLKKELSARKAPIKYRLIGVSCSDLCAGEEGDRGDLSEPDLARIKARESAVDALRKKFGAEAIAPGLIFRVQKPDKDKPKFDKKR